MPRLSFSLRDVFWLTLVVGMGVAWAVDRSGLEQERKFSAIRAEQLSIIALEGGCLERTEDGRLIRPTKDAD